MVITSTQATTPTTPTPPTTSSSLLVHNILTTTDLTMDDELDGMTDSEDDDYGETSGDLMTATMEDEVTAQLAAAGPIGMAAAAAIASAKKRKRPHQFETNPSIRKRQQTRLLRKLRQTIDEFTIRVGMQAVVLVAIPGKTQNSYKCFGAKPLEDVVRNLRAVVVQDLEAALALHAPVLAPEDPSLHELPPLVIDGIPTPVEKMTQAQLRAFIPLMLKYSTGRGKPGWGKESTRPQWWPEDLPWANVRMDARTEDEKQKVSWTHALRQIVINCYKYHSREDLLPVFSGEPHCEEDVKPAKIVKHHHQQQLVSQSQSQQSSAQQHQQQQQGTHFTPTVLQTISNSDGTVSIIQVDPTNSIITLPDGTTAQVQGVATLSSLQHHPSHSHSHPHPSSPLTMDLSQLQHSLSDHGQIIITGEDGQAYPVTVSGMITVPVSAGGGGGGQQIYQIATGGGGGGSQQVQQQKYFVLEQKRKPAAAATAARLLRVGKVQQTIEVHPSMVTPMLIPKLEPVDEIIPHQIPVSALTGDVTQTQLVSVSSTGQVVHDDKIYQICEYFKPTAESQQEECVTMVTEEEAAASGGGVEAEEAAQN